MLHDSELCHFAARLSTEDSVGSKQVIESILFGEIATGATLWVALGVKWSSRNIL